MTEKSMADRNPYAPPQAEVESSPQGVYWREGKDLVMRPGTVLPRRCVKCNASATQTRYKRKLTWHHPAWYLLVPVNILVYVLVAIIVRKSAEVDPGLCPHHARQRARGVLGAWAVALGGIALIVFGLGSDDGMIPVVLGLGMAFVAILIGIFRVRILYPSRISRDIVRLRGCGKPFLDSLPDSEQRQSESLI